jgi:ABC-type transport system involved in cytochrome bd biosynthesis fused ATPase/permease subunit
MPHVIKWDPDSSKQSEITKLAIPKISLLERIQVSGTKLALWGKAGVGKSSICHWLAISWASNSLC